jgi:CheY-like chemotaxis protein
MSLLESTRPDVICLDVLMPEQTGASLYRAIMAHPQLARAQVIVLSGLASRDELPHILGCEGAIPKRVAFIEKPINIEEVLKAVKSALDGSTEGRP